MDNSKEELEPLFDYHRVQPVNFISLEDDSDSSPAYIPKRRKFNQADDKKVVEVDGDGNTNKPIVLDLDDEEEDWLRPPPKNVAPVSKREEDSAIKQLRLKKRELESVVESAVNALRAVDEASKRSATEDDHPGVEEETPSESVEESAKPASDRPKIVISIQDKAGTKQCRVYADDKFEQLFKKYAEKLKVAMEKLVFTFDGDKINPESTPNSLGMEDDDQIEVNVKAN